MVTRFTRVLLLFLFFAFSCQTTQLQAFNLKTTTESVITWFKEKSPFSFLCISGALIGIFYLWTKKDQTKKSDTNSKPSKSNIQKDFKKNFTQNKKKKSFEVVVPESLQKIFNIPVLKQNGLTCGFHTLKNALSYFENSHSQLETIKISLLTDQNHFESKYKIWAEKINEFRKKTALQKIIQKHLEKNIKTNQPYTQKYRELIQNISAGAAEFAIAHFNNKNETYKISNKLINKLIETEINNPTNNLNSLLKEKSTLNNHFNNFEKLSIEIKKSDINTLKINQSEEIDSGELNYLLTLETDKEQVRNHFTIVEDHENFHMTFGEKWEEWLTTQNNFHLFLIGNMSEKYQNSSGHWYLLAAQKKNNQTRYFVSDSLGHNRENDERVKKIISKLEG